MAVPTFTEISDLALDRAQVNVTTDPAFTSTVIARHINDAYADIWEISGGGIISATHTTIWEAYDTIAFSTKASITARIGEIVRVYQASANNVTGGTGTAPTILQKAEQERVLYLQRSATALYANTKLYSITRIDEVDETRIPRFRLDLWPVQISGAFFPIDYIPQRTDIDASTNTQPSCTDLEGRDIALLTAARLAPLAGRHDLVPSILMDVSERTRASLERKIRSLMDAGQQR